MKSFKIPTFLASLFGFCLFWGLDAPPAHADFTFGKPVNLKSVIPVIDPAHESIDCISSDGLEIYIVSDRPGGFGDYDIWVLKRPTGDSDWGPPENLGPAVNSASQENGAWISADGLTLHFASNRPGGYGNFDIYKTTRATTVDPWGPAVNLGPAINSPAADGDAWVSPDGLELYVSSRRSGGYGSGDIYVASRSTTADPWGELVNLGPTVNSAYDETSLCLSPDGLLLLYSDNFEGGTAPRPGGHGGSDVWMTRRTTVSSPWQASVNLGLPVNSSNNEIMPYISRDGSTLYFVTYSGGVWDNWQAPIIWLSDFTFGEPVNVGPPLNGSANDGTYSFSKDGLELFFASDRGRAPGDYDLYVLMRPSVADVWSEPINLGPTINSSYYDSMPCISPDGLELFFNSQRPGGSGLVDLWVIRRTTKADAWGPPVNLGPVVNSTQWEQHPTISSDGLTLIFESYRPGGYGGVDLWVTTRGSTRDAWTSPMNLGPTVNTPYDEWWPRLSPDDRLLFFTSPDRPGGFGKTDLWMTRRATTKDQWSVPVNVGPAVNTAAEEGAPSFSLDGSILYFASDRPGGLGGWDQWQVPIIPDVDFNGDGIVDMKDFSKLAQYWGQDESSVDIGPMPWGDGVVDIQDVSVLVEHWLTGF